MWETTNIRTISAYSITVKSSNHICSIRPEHQTTHLRLVVVILQWQFHRYKISQILVWANATSVEKQIRIKINVVSCTEPGREDIWTSRVFSLIGYCRISVGHSLMRNRKHQTCLGVEKKRAQDQTENCLVCGHPNITSYDCV